MNIVSISWVRNEGDILEEFVRHHCRFVDRMVIINHRSEDNSLEILQKLAAEGLPIEIRTDTSLLHKQSKALTQLFHDVRHRLDPDWVLPLDADEFIVAPRGKSLKDTLASYTKDRVVRIPWVGYVPTPQDVCTERRVLQRIVHRRTFEPVQWHKVCIPSALAKGVSENDGRIGLGSHIFFRQDTVFAQTIDAQDLYLAHFPVRSPQQIATKVFCGWLSYMADPERTPGGIFQWKAIFDVLKQGALPSADTLQTFALEYAAKPQWEAMQRSMGTAESLDNFFVESVHTLPAVEEAPLPFSYELRYPHEARNPWALLADAAEELALSCARSLKNAATPQMPDQSLSPSAHAAYASC